MHYAGRFKLLKSSSQSHKPHPQQSSQKSLDIIRKTLTYFVREPVVIQPVVIQPVMIQPEEFESKELELGMSTVLRDLQANLSIMEARLANWSQ